MKKIISCLIFCVMFLFWQSHFIKADELFDLKEQVLKMQQENTELQKRLNDQNMFMERLLNKIDALETSDKLITEDIETLKRKESLYEENMGEYKVLSEERPFGPKLDMRGFADITFKAEDDVSDDKQNYNSFTMGQLDMFITSALSENISVLSETVFEYSEEDNDLETEVERFEIKYSINELINIKIGRMHTALGFWNTEYHHSTWTHTSAFRPLIHKWEDEGGVMPNHFVGLYLSGKKDFDSFDFEYDLGIANGRGSHKGEVQSLQDGNDSKAYSMRLQVVPYFLPGIKLGLSAYSDKIPADSSTPGRSGEIDELIAGGHVIYFRNDLELMAEIIHINHDDEVSHEDYDTFGLYLQAAYQFDKLKPYYRFDYLDFGDEDPFFEPDSPDATEHIIGVRWDPIIWNSIKLEYKFSDKEDFNDEHSIAVQSAVSF